MGLKMKCLIVDDDPTCTHLMQMHLSQFAECDMVYNGAEAIQAFRNAIEEDTPYDLICLDMVMPEMDGCQTLQAINKIQADHGISDSDRAKVIMITSRDDSKTIMDALCNGCNSYIKKPVEEFKLVNALKEMKLIQPENSNIF